jgi:hypothetical protein
VGERANQQGMITEMVVECSFQFVQIGLHY